MTRFNKLLASSFFALPVLTFGLEDPKPEIKSVSLFVLKIGQTTKLTIFGENLTPIEVKCSNPKVVVKLIASRATDGADKPKGSRAVDLEVSSPADATPDTPEFSLKNQSGEPAKRKIALISVVGEDLALKKPSGSFKDAMIITTPITVVGNLSDGQPAILKFEAKAGEQLRLSGIAGRSGSTLDLIMRVLNSRHITLALDVGHMQTDRKIEFNAPADGWYYVELTSEEMKGAQTNDFRFSISRQPP